MTFAHIISSTVMSVDQIGVVPWSLFSWAMWLTLHMLYKKLFQSLLLRISVKEPQRQRLIKIYWRIAFAAVTTPFALLNLNLHLYDINLKFYHILENYIVKWLHRDVPSVQTKLFYVLLTGFYLNNICEISIEKGIRNIDFVVSEFFTIFFVTTFPLRCILFGVALTTVINVEKCILEACKLCNCISSIVNSKTLEAVACYMFFVHCSIWCLVYLHILPKYFILKSVSEIKRGDDIYQIFIMMFSTISLWSYYMFEIINSPISRLIFNFIYGQLFNLETILFNEEHVDLSLTEWRNSNNKYTSEHLHREKFNVGYKPRNTKNLQFIYQTVKCVIRIKRKLKKIREKKEKEELDKLLTGNKKEEMVQGNDNLEAESQSQ